MLRLFKNSHPLILIFIPILSGITAFSNFPQKIDIAHAQENIGISTYLIKFIAESGITYLLPLTTFVLLILLSLLLIRLDFTLNFSGQRNFLTPLIFLILTGFSKSDELLIPVLISLLALVPVFFLLNNSNRKDFAADEYFKAGILTALSACFYPKYAWYLIFIFLSLLTIRPMIWREWAAVVMGFITPYLIIFPVIFMISGTVPVKNFTIIPDFYGLTIPKNHSFFSLFLILDFVLLIIISIYFLFRQYPSLNILKRKIFRLFFFFFIFAWIINFLSNQMNIESMISAAIPVSFLISYYFMGTKKKIFSEILFDLFIALFIGSQIFTQICF
jgi:hypothetical protein